MNPLLFKAHPLLSLTVDLFTNPTAHTQADWLRLLAIYLLLNLAWAWGLRWASKKAVEFSPPYWLAFLMAIPAMLLYQPIMLTLLDDVLGQRFHFADRAIFVICIVVASQMLGAFFAFALRHPRYDRPIGISDGLTISLLLWLWSVFLGLGLLGLGALVPLI